MLASARLLNQALALLSPLLLVRLLDIVDYGRYRQFMAVAMLVTSLGGFALTANLTYLLARTPDRAPADITKTSVLMFFVAVVSALIVALAHPWIVPAEIATSWWLLSLYVFMFLNLEVVVAYWLARRRSVEVMQYTLVVTVWRLATLLGAALYFRDVEMIFVTLVCAEAVKNLAIYLWLRARGLLVFRWDHEVLREQVRLVTPLGLGSILNKANDFGRVVVGTVLGPVPLAIYSTAHYQVPVVNIVQTSLSDVIFPDLVKRAQRDPAEGLQLWKRAQMMVAAVIVPAWVLLCLFRRAADPPRVHRRLCRGDSVLPGVPAADAAPVLPVLHAVAQCRGQRLVRHLERHCAGDQRRADRRAHAGFRPVGTDAGPGREPDLVRLLPRSPRHGALRRAGLADLPLAQARAGRCSRHCWRAPSCTARSPGCRALT